MIFICDEAETFGGISEGNSNILGYGMCHFMRVLFQLENKFLGLFCLFCNKFLGQVFGLE